MVECADDKAALVVIKAQEAKPKLTSTQELRAAVEAMHAEDKRAPRSGGPGYGDRRDKRDREEMAEREREANNG